jgi:hypothetical protein
MFDRIKKAFTRDEKPEPPAQAASAALGPVSQWAASQGFEFSGDSASSSFAVDGQIAGRPWRLEAGKPTRRYIQGTELRARADLGVNPDALVLVLNRPLKDLLEKQAYALYTDSLQTQVDPNLPEEMRLLSMFEECGWDALPRLFWSRYSVVADDREHAMAWVDAVLTKQLLEWPAPAPSIEVPFVMLLLRGKAYLRMQQDISHLPAVQHAAAVFTTACETALGAFKVR